MEITNAAKTLGALAQETRLTTFRLLVQHGSRGMPAGEIARALEVPHNTLSTHLNILVNAGLVDSRRESRSIIYSVNFRGVREMLGYLMQDCCQADENDCLAVLDRMFPECCSSNS